VPTLADRLCHPRFCLGVSTRVILQTAPRALTAPSPTLLRSTVSHLCKSAGTINIIQKSSDRSVRVVKVAARRDKRESGSPKSLTATGGRVISQTAACARGLLESVILRAPASAALNLCPSQILLVNCAAVVWQTVLVEARLVTTAARTASGFFPSRCPAAGSLGVWTGTRLVSPI
jgi:hypothetical protein